MGSLPSDVLRILTQNNWARSTANACYKEVADIASTLDQFDLAIDKYEAVATASLSSPLTRYSVKEYYFKAGLCHLCRGVRIFFDVGTFTNISHYVYQDTVQTRRAIEHYQSQDNTFSGTRECKFLVAITETVEAGDQEGL